MKTLLLCFLTFTSPVASFFMFNEEPAESNQPTYNPFAPTSVVDPYSFWFSGSSNSASENAESATPLHGAYSSPYSTSGSSYGNYQQPQQYNTFSNYNPYSGMNQYQTNSNSFALRGNEGRKSVNFPKNFNF